MLQKYVILNASLKVVVNIKHESFIVKTVYNTNNNNIIFYTK